MINLNTIYETISKELNISPEVVKAAYRSYWEFIYKKISELPLKEDLTKEEFEKLRTNFNVPSLGKFYTTYEDLVNIKKGYSYKQLLIENVKNKKDKTNV